MKKSQQKCKDSKDQVKSKEDTQHKMPQFWSFWGVYSINVKLRYLLKLPTNLNETKLHKFVYKSGLYSRDSVFIDRRQFFNDQLKS